MRMRKDDAEAWQRGHERSFFFAGPAKGAGVAAWKVAARAEAAAAAAKVSHSQLLLDLEKCFERVPHEALVREAEAVGYPLRVLRLALAAYLLPRTVSISGVHSRQLTAERGITAGSGLATAELRVLLIRLLDRIAREFPQVGLTEYVDGTTLVATGTAAAVSALITRAGAALCDGLLHLGLALSPTKHRVVASSAVVADKVATDLRRFGVKAATQAELLGTATAAGARRATAKQKSRLGAFAAKLRRLLCLKRAGASTARLLRTGCNAAVAYGDDVVGVSCTTLLTRRRAAADAVSTATRGRDLDLALALADERASQCTDPAHAAHTLPIAQWAEAVWGNWLPRPMLRLLIRAAKAKLTSALRPWSCVRGPAGAAVASAARLGWHFVDAATLVTDQGRTLELDADPPAVVKREVTRAVRRWRWRRIEARYPHLDSGGEGRGACLAPVIRLLRGNGATAHWRAEHRAALRSVVTGTQWPQHRLAAAGLVDDGRCRSCLARALDMDAHEVPPGTLLHRIAVCPTTAGTYDVTFAGAAPARAALAHLLGSIGRVGAAHHDAGVAQEDFARACVDLPRDVTVTLPFTVASLVARAPRAALRAARSALLTSWWSVTAVTRVLVPAPRVARFVPPADGTMQWHVQLVDGQSDPTWTWYTDASAIDTYSEETRRLGWAFAAYNRDGECVASASGVPPPWVEDNSGAEAWALAMAASCACPGATFMTDSLVTVDAIRRGAPGPSARSVPSHGFGRNSLASLMTPRTRSASYGFLATVWTATSAASRSATALC